MDREILMLAVNIWKAVEKERKLLSLESIWAAFFKEELLDLKKNSRKSIIELGLNDSETLIRNWDSKAVWGFTKNSIIWSVRIK